MKTIYYLAYYDTDDAEDRVHALSATNKIDYISRTISALGYNVEIISASYTKNKSKAFDAKIKNIGENVNVKLFKTLKWGNKVQRKLSVVYNAIQIFFSLMKINKDDKIIVYHSLGYMNLVNIAHRLKKFNLTMEVEEIYSDVTGNKKLREKEIQFLKKADSYIFATESISKVINTSNKNEAIIYGTYKIEDKIKESIYKDNRIHVVYAGTFDYRKGGVKAAIECSKYLNANYHLHIIGFGTESEVEKVKDEVNLISPKCECKLTFDGCLRGEEYKSFLQSCDIGLSTQNPNEKYNDTSFPSKVLSYMSNDLKVVSAKISVVENSAIGQYLYFYNKNDPKEIANTIMKVNDNDYSAYDVLSKLDNDFKEKIKLVL